MKIELVATKTIDYPSGSALEFSNSILYVIGDDVNYILCLDNDWNEIKRIKLFDFVGTRIPKSEKSDLECASIIDGNLVVLGSGSKSPQRDFIFEVNLETLHVDKQSIAPFYNQLKKYNEIIELNIEGFTVCNDDFLFFNRATTTQQNHLITTNNKLFKNKSQTEFNIIPIEINNLNDIQLGISGACYDEINDTLFLTASAENTNNTYDDGEIIGSVLAIIENASCQINQQKIKIENFINLDTIDSSFDKQKVESVCIKNRDRNCYNLILVADNDDGKSVLFEIHIKI